MKFLSLASGIEAASVAFKPLGWKAIGFSEIDPFASAVLAYHHPEVPNFGDMTRFIEWPEEAFAEADIVVGGPPCQAFSVAGMRAGLNDARGNLTLTYAELINHADDVRTRRGRPPVLALYENVPGILSDRTNAFGCLLAALAGEDEPIVVKKWPRAGVVDGRRRRVAWVTLDAQYFGVAQRRRRVFVLAVPREFVERLGERADPAEILSIGRCLRRDTPSRESEGKESPAQSAISVALRGREGGGTAELGDEVQNCLRASSGGGDKPHVLCLAHGQGGGENVLAFDTTQITSAENRSNPQPGGPCHPLSAGAHPPAIAIQAGALRTNPASGPDGVGVQEDHAYTLEARSEVQAVAFAQNQLGEVRSGEVFNTLNTNSNASGRNTPMVATVAAPVEHEALYNKGFNHGGNYASTQETHAGKILRALREAVGEEAFAKWGLGILDSLQSPEILRQALHGVSIRPAPFSRSWVVHGALSRQEDGPGWLLQSLRETGCEGCPPQGWEPPEQLNGELRAYLQELSQPGAQASRFMRDLWWAAQGAGLLRQALSAVQEMGRPTHGQSQPAHGDMQVRRLTVEECEFLQGFPRGYTLIPWRKKPSSECPDGPRYRALGNSWAVPVAAWIARRIHRQIAT